MILMNSFFFFFLFLVYFVLDMLEIPKLVISYCIVFPPQNSFSRAKLSKPSEIEKLRKISQLVKLKQKGMSYEKIKEYAENRTLIEDNKNATAPKQYQDIELDGNFQDRCQSIIEFKRERIQKKY